MLLFLISAAACTRGSSLATKQSVLLLQFSFVFCRLAMLPVLPASPVSWWNTTASTCRPSTTPLWPAAQSVYAWPPPPIIPARCWTTLWTASTAYGVPQGCPCSSRSTPLLVRAAGRTCPSASCMLAPLSASAPTAPTRACRLPWLEQAAKRERRTESCVSSLRAHKQGPSPDCQCVLVSLCCEHWFRR